MDLFAPTLLKVICKCLQCFYQYEILATQMNFIQTFFKFTVDSRWQNLSVTSSKPSVI